MKTLTLTKQKQEVAIKRTKIDYIRQIDNNIRTYRPGPDPQLSSDEFDFLLDKSLEQLEEILESVFLQAMANKFLKEYLATIA